MGYYYLKLAWLSLRKTPVLSVLMITAIATGIAASLTTLTLYSVISSNPMADRNETAFAVQLDSWDPDETFWAANGLPLSLTFRDAKALYEANIGGETVIMAPAGLTVKRPDSDQAARVEPTRMTTNAFFSLFEVDFIHGQPWNDAEDRDGDQRVVLSQSLSKHFFDDRNPVGETLLLEDELYTVTGVVSDSWSMQPSVYDLTLNAFKKSPQLYMPFLNYERRNFPFWGDMNGWKHEAITSHLDFLMSERVWVQTWISLNDSQQVEAMREFLRNYINEQKQIGRFQRPLKFQLNTPEEWLAIHRVVTRDNQILVALSLAFLLVCLVNSVILLLAKFLRKAPEAGLRRALGASRNAIFVQHIAEAAMICMVGAALGLLLSWLGLTGIRWLYSDYQAVAVMQWATVLAALVLAFVCSLLSGLLPAWQVARAAPSRYLK